MNLQNAKSIGQKARAYEHCVKLLRRIEKDGSAIMKINCTGIEFHVEKGDGIYLRLKTVLASLTEDLNLATQRMEGSTPRVAPIGAAPESAMSPDEIRRAKTREYMRKYRETHREQIRQYDREYRRERRKK